MSIESASFCVVPWLHQLVNERGFIKVCCVAEGAGNFVTNERGARMHVQDGASQDTILNSPRLKALRQTMLDGQWDPICRRCQVAEQAGGASSRTGRNHHFRHALEALAATTAPDGTLVSPAIRHMDLRLGNACNLTCRMCSPGASRLWIEPYNRVQPEAYRIEPQKLADLKKIDWIDDPAVWRQFAESLPSIEWLHFAGGEPMLVPQMFYLLRLCVESGDAGHIDLSYTTNITRLPDAVADLWPRFKSVAVNCSIDGYGALNEYIRRPSRWTDIDRNLHTLDTHFQEWNLLQVVVTTTVQIYNVLDLDKLYRYLRTEFTHVSPAPTLNPLSWPAYLSTANLTPEVKQRARERLLLEKNRPEYQTPQLAWLISSIDALIAHMDQPASVNQWRDFALFTAESEREFKDSLTAAAPELVELLDSSLRHHLPI